MAWGIELRYNRDFSTDYSHNIICIVMAELGVFRPIYYICSINSLITRLSLHGDSRDSANSGNHQTESGLGTRVIHVRTSI